MRGVRQAHHAGKDRRHCKDTTNSTVWVLQEVHLGPLFSCQSHGCVHGPASRGLRWRIPQKHLFFSKNCGKAGEKERSHPKACCSPTKSWPLSQGQPHDEGHV